MSTKGSKRGHSSAEATTVAGEADSPALGRSDGSWPAQLAELENELCVRFALDDHVRPEWERPDQPASRDRSRYSCRLHERAVVSSTAWERGRPLAPRRRHAWATSKGRTRTRQGRAMKKARRREWRRSRTTPAPRLFSSSRSRAKHERKMIRILALVLGARGGGRRGSP